MINIPTLVPGQIIVANKDLEKTEGHEFVPKGTQYTVERVEKEFITMSHTESDKVFYLCPPADQDFDISIL